MSACGPLCPAAVVPCGSRAVPGACPVSSDNKKRVIYRSSSGIELFFFSPEDTEGLHMHRAPSQDMHASSPCVKSAPHHAGPGRAATQRTKRAQGVRCQPRPAFDHIQNPNESGQRTAHSSPPSPRQRVCGMPAQPLRVARSDGATSLPAPLLRSALNVVHHHTRCSARGPHTLLHGRPGSEGHAAARRGIARGPPARALLLLLQLHQ